MKGVDPGFAASTTTDGVGYSSPTFGVIRESDTRSCRIELGIYPLEGGDQESTERHGFVECPGTSGSSGGGRRWPTPRPPGLEPELPIHARSPSTSVTGSRWLDWHKPEIVRLSHSCSEKHPHRRSRCSHFDPVNTSRASTLLGWRSTRTWPGH